MFNNASVYIMVNKFWISQIITQLLHKNTIFIKQISSKHGPSKISKLMRIGCLHILPIVTNAAMNTSMQISLQDPDFNSFGYIVRSGLLDYMIVLFFLGILILFSITVTLFNINSVWVPIFHFLPTLIYFLNGHSSRCEVISHCSFEHFIYLLAICVPFWERCCSSPLPTFWGFFVCFSFLLLSYSSALYIL